MLRTDILMLEFTSNDRDLNIMAPVYLYLKKKSGLKVRFKNLYLAYFYVYFYKPKLILLSNAHGDGTTYEMVKHFRKLNLNVITLTTEGNFTEKYLFGYLWGWNNDKILYQDYLLLWNEKSKRIILDKHPELEPKLRVTGSVGHDRYRLLPFLGKNDFLRRNGLDKKYSKVVGIASFGLFCYLGNEDYFEIVNPHFSKHALEIYRQDIEKLRQLYYDIIKDNPDILFILRPHPEQVVRGNVHNSELAGLENLENVYWSSRYTNLPGIDDTISVCDLWVAYESNTSIESWLMNKPTIYVNPTTTEFERENHYRGNAIAESKAQLQDFIDEFYKTGHLSAFDAKKEQRQHILEEILQYTDGKNHKRSAEMVLELFKTLPEPDYNEEVIKELKNEIFWRHVRDSGLHKIPVYFKLRKKAERNFRVAPKKQNSIKYYIRRFKRYVS